MAAGLLWLVWFALLPGSCLLHSLHDASQGQYEFARSHVDTFHRMASSVTLVVAAWLWAYGAARTDWRTYSAWIALGMTWGCMGDFFMARLVPGVPEQTLGGIASFAIGHLCYMAGTIHTARRLGLWRPSAWIGSFAVWQLFALVGWYVIVFRGTENTALRYPALGYTLLLAGTAAMATALALQQARFTQLALGAALFLLSDLVLAVGMFRKESPLGGDSVWMLYGPGQMLIVYAIVWLLRPRWAEPSNHRADEP